jgi:acetyltransferase-like isoleucine patch superfamily enzyme
MTRPSLQRTRSYPASVVRKFLLKLRATLIWIRLRYMRDLLHMDVHPTARISLKANLDWTYPRGVHIGENTYVAFGAVILAHDMTRLLQTDTFIGKNCFIGAKSIVMPGVRIGDGCIIGSGSVVTKDVPAGSMAAGNPATVVRSGIRTREFGILQEAHDEVTALERGAATK